MNLLVEKQKQKINFRIKIYLIELHRLILYYIRSYTLRINFFSFNFRRKIFAIFTIDNEKGIDI